MLHHRHPHGLPGPGVPSDLGWSNPHRKHPEAADLDAFVLCQRFRQVFEDDVDGLVDISSRKIGESGSDADAVWGSPALANA